MKVRATNDRNVSVDVTELVASQGIEMLILRGELKEVADRSASLQRDLWDAQEKNRKLEERVRVIARIEALQRELEQHKATGYSRELVKKMIGRVLSDQHDSWMGYICQVDRCRCNDCKK